LCNRVKVSENIDDSKKPVAVARAVRVELVSVELCVDRSVLDIAEIHTRHDFYFPLAFGIPGNLSMRARNQRIGLVGVEEDSSGTLRRLLDSIGSRYRPSHLQI
jgi:hypothetical protein